MAQLEAIRFAIGIINDPLEGADDQGFICDASEAIPSLYSLEKTMCRKYQCNDARAAVGTSL